jgi:hypothetical protein
MTSNPEKDTIFPTELFWGEIYNINEKYIYLKESKLGIKARIDRRVHPDITEENFSKQNNPPSLVSFIINRDEKTEAGIYTGYSKGSEQLAWEAMYPQGSVCDIYIFFANEFSFKIKFENHIYEQEFGDAFDSLKIYFLSGLAHSGSTVPLRYRNWKSKTNSPNFIYPFFNPDAKDGDHVEAEVFYVRENSVKAKSKIRDIFYLMDANKNIYRAECNTFYDYRDYFTARKRHMLIVDVFNKFEGLINAHFDNLIIEPRTTEYTSNELVKAKVVNPMPRGVRCISEKNENIFLTKDQICKNDNIKVFNLLSPGDEVLLMAKVDTLNNNSKVEFEFVRLENRIFESEKLNDLFDARASYSKGAINGFGRTSEFRNTVLDYFDHTCALCGAYLKFLNFSSAEAAHIVPRSSIGVNRLENSLCLCKEHHWSFDRGMWSVDSQGKIIVCDELRKDANFNNKYEEYLGKCIGEKVLEKVNPKAFEWHRLNIFK